MKRFIFLTALAVLLAVGPVLAKTSQDGSFISVKGNVLVKNSSGSSRPAKVGSKVAQDERVVTAKDAEATLQFFDGSQLILKPGTDLRLTKLEKPSEKDKVLQFKILVGELLAKVEKLASTKSSFEIEAGGVVCGVRGTEFSMKYDSAHTLDLHVSSGSVYAKVGGVIKVLNQGNSIRWKHGDGGPTEDTTFVYGAQDTIANNVAPAATPTDKTLSQDLALRDLKAQFVKGLQTNHDNVFTDPAVGGLSVSSITAKVGQNEAVP
jgi:hypothetical protein